MSKAIKSLTFEEFSNNVTDIFDRVVRDNETVLIERGNGGAVVLKPAQQVRPKRRKRTAADHEAFLSSFGGWPDLDVDRFLAEVYESRNISSRPRVEL